MITKVSKSSRKGKKMVAYFSNGRKTHFGQDGSKTYLDHKDKQKRKAYQARHAIDIETQDPYRAGYLSLYLLWGDHTNLTDAVKAYNKRFFGLLQL